MFEKEIYISYFLQINLKLFVPLFIFGLLIGFFRQRACSNFNQKPFGDFIVNFFNLIGIPIHELGHLIFGFIFGYQITGVCLYRTQKQASKNNGTLGYVNMRHHARSLPDSIYKSIGQFFIGIGPLLFGPTVILVIAHFLPSKVIKITDILTDMVQNKYFSFKILKDWFLSLDRIDYLFFFLFLYLVVGIGLNLELSQADLKTASRGFLFFELLIVLVICVCIILHIDILSFVDFLQKRFLFVASIGVTSSVLVLLISMI